MAVKIYMSKEEIREGIKQTYQSVDMCKKDHKWLYLLWIGSFALLVFLNYTLPNIYTIEKKPIYDVEIGFVGLILTVFGFTFFLNAFFFRSIGGETIIFYIFTWIVGAIICVTLLYFGLPLFFGFEW